MGASEIITGMLPAHAAIFSEEYFTHPAFPIKFLFRIACFFGFFYIDPEFHDGLVISNSLIMNKGL